MNSKLSTLALSALIAVAGIGTAGTAGAATSATKAANQDTCHALIKQADSALSTHKGDAAKSQSAKEHLATGKADCKAGSYEKGAEQLRQAINDLGMKPVN
jgi:hypothetical protein